MNASSPDRGRALILAVAGPGERDGIGDYAWCLAQALAASHATTLIVRRGPAGSVQPPPTSGAPTLSSQATAALAEINSWRDLSAPAWTAAEREASGVFVQYFPQAFVNGDFGALVDWLAARRRAGRATVVTLHEYWPHASLLPGRMAARWRSRRALSRLAAVSTAMVVSQPYSKQEVIDSGLVSAAMLHVIPVGSAVPRTAPPASKDTSPALQARPILAMFGQPAMMNLAAVCELARWIESQSDGPTLWWFSRSDDELIAWWRAKVGAPSQRVVFFGGLDAPELSARLAQATLGLGLYVDGASTRRSSLAALLEHGLPIVAIDDRYTDDLVRTSGAVELVPATALAKLTPAVERLLADTARRTAMSGAAERFFAGTLGWPKIADAYRRLERER